MKLVAELFIMFGAAGVLVVFIGLIIQGIDPNIRCWFSLGTFATFGIMGSILWLAPTTK